MLVHKVFCAALALAIPAFAMTRVRIGSVAPEYRPTAGAEMPEPVSMEDFRFEINKETGRARVVVDYTYPDMVAFGVDGGSGPESTAAQLPGLKYDREAKEVVYDAGGKTTVCATVRGSRIRSTGSCTVVSQLADHAREIDTFFEVR